MQSHITVGDVNTLPAKPKSTTAVEMLDTALKLDMGSGHLSSNPLLAGNYLLPDWSGRISLLRSRPRALLPGKDKHLTSDNSNLKCRRTTSTVQIIMLVLAN